MRIEIDWDGDGSRIGIFDVVRGEPNSDHVPFTVTCSVCNRIETIRYNHIFAAREGVETDAAVDGSCNEPCEGVAK